MLDELLEELLKEAYRRYKEQQRGEGEAERRTAGPMFPPAVGPDPWATWEQQPQLEGLGRSVQPAAADGIPLGSEATSQEGVSSETGGADATSPSLTASLPASPPTSAAAVRFPSVEAAASSAGPLHPREGMKWSLIFSPPRSLDPYRPPGLPRRFGR